MVTSKIECRERVFIAQRNDRKARIFKLGEFAEDDGKYHGDTPYLINPLNLAIINLAL